MKNVLLIGAMVSMPLLFLSCSGDEIEPDILPKKFEEIQLRSDEIYIYNGGTPEGTRLDPLLNDSIKVAVNITYSSPNSGIVSFIDNEGWFYKPNENFFGEDSLTYTACYGTECYSARIKLYVEQPLDVNTCVSELQGETVTVLKDQPTEIRLFMNDVLCPFTGWGINSPEHGTFATYSYSGGYKNTVYVYYPPRGFVGTDRFTYRIFTTTGTLEATCTINVVNN